MEVITCACCGKEVPFVFTVCNRENRFNDGLEEVCLECAEFSNDEYYCGSFRGLVSFDLFAVDTLSSTGSVRGSLVA